jgi:phosphate transport system substrate-binding protein
MMASLASPSTIRAPALVAALLLAAPARAEEVLRVTGTGSALGVLARIAPAFEKANPGVKLKILPSLGSAGAVKAVAAGALDLGLSGRTLRPDEAALGLDGITVARTPFLFAVGPRAGATRIGADELASIYRGERSTWPGGERIRLVLRPSADTDTLFVRSISPAMAAAVDAAQARPGMLLAATNQDSDTMLARTPGGLGASTLAQLLAEQRGLTPLAWEGVEPTLANLVAGTYPLAKPIVVVLPRSPPPGPAVRRLLTFLASAEGRRLLEASGCQPVAFPAGG